MPNVITVPDCDFSVFYYPDILKELLSYLRRHRTELGLTDENEYEVHVQLCRAFALVGHLNNTRLDLVSQELLIDSLRLLESLKRLLKLIGVSLSGAAPARAELLAKLSEVTTVDQVGFVPELSEFATESVPPIPFEVMEVGGVPLDRTDRAGHVFGCEQVKTGVGEVGTTAPDVFKRTGGSVFDAGDVGRHLFVAEGLGSNGGEFRAIEFIDADNMRVVRVPGSGSPAFQNETGLTWVLMAFTADFDVENYTPGSTYVPWTTPVAGDCLYLGHPQCMPSQLDVDITVPSVAITGCWEYYDDQLSKFPPTLVTDNHDGTLTFNINSLLGTPDRHGANIVVEYVPTQTKERLVSTFSSSANKILTTGLLGQVTPSINVEDYLVTATWIPFDNQSDGSINFTQDGAISWNLPQTIDRNWREGEVNLVGGWWARYRIVAVAGGVTSPTIEEIRIDGGDQHILYSVTQGETMGPQILGSSDGSADQRFTLPETPFFDESEDVEVDETGTGTWVTWVRVENFLNSGATSRHYMIETDAQDKATVIFGSGTNGKIPPAGTDNVRGAYRVGGDADGNVGAGEISTNSDGVNGIAEVSNPRPAYDWRMKDGGTDQDLERVKRDAPAGLRTRDTASTMKDIEWLAVKKFIASDGTRPVARAVAFEEGLGPKTVKLMVVGNGGATLTTQQKIDLEEYFNGNRYSIPPKRGVLLTNHRVYVFNYEPLLITISATVVWPGGNVESLRNAMLALLTPLAVESDGATSTWDFNGWVSFSRICSEIHAVDPAVSDVPTLLINTAPTSLRLSANQLPISTSTSITFNIQQAP